MPQNLRKESHNISWCLYASVLTGMMHRKELGKHLFYDLELLTVLERTGKEKCPRHLGNVERGPSCITLIYVTGRTPPGLHQESKRTKEPKLVISEHHPQVIKIFSTFQSLILSEEARRF